MHVGMMERVTGTAGTDMCTSKVGFKDGEPSIPAGGLGLCAHLDDGFKGSELKRDGRKAKTKDESLFQQAHEEEEENNL